MIIDFLTRDLLFLWKYSIWYSKQIAYIALCKFLEFDENSLNLSLSLPPPHSSNAFGSCIMVFILSVFWDEKRCFWAYVIIFVFNRSLVKRNEKSEKRLVYNDNTESVISSLSDFEIWAHLMHNLISLLSPSKEECSVDFFSREDTRTIAHSTSRKRVVCHSNRIFIPILSFRFTRLFV